MIIRTSLPLERDSNHPQLVLLGSCIDSTVVKKMPFWRESITDCPPGPGVSSWDWKFMYSVAPDCVIDPAWLESELPGAEWLLTRIDTRTYERHPYIARRGKTVVTTLRPWGGLGAQPYGLNNNPAGCELLRILMRLAESG